MHEFFYDGYQAYLSGVTKEDCPYQDFNQKGNHWLGGWETSYEDKLNKKHWDLVESVELYEDGESDHGIGFEVA